MSHPGLSRFFSSIRASPQPPVLHPLNSEYRVRDFPLPYQPCYVIRPSPRHPPTLLGGAALNYPAKMDRGGGGIYGRR